MKFRVTKADIKKAISLIPENGIIEGEFCPIALSLKRKLKRKVEVSPGFYGGLAYVLKKDGVLYKILYTLQLSGAANIQAKRFDRDRSFKPGWYEVFPKRLIQGGHECSH